MTKSELEERVHELEETNSRISLDLEWERLLGLKRMQAMAMSRKSRRGTQKAKKQGHGNGTKKVKAGPIPVDAFGQREGTQGHRMNAPIISLIEREQYCKIKPEILSQMTGGQWTASRFQAHLSWLRRRGLL
jgi:hypothetical protein